MFEKGMKVKIKYKTGENRDFKVLKGKVVLVTKYFILVQGKNYRECFKYSDFKCRDAITLKV